MSPLIDYNGSSPQIHKTVFIAPGVFLIGDVQIGEDSSVWFNSVLRGDVNPIRIGKRTNIQDLSLLHTSMGKTPTLIGNDVTAGHRVILHGCEVADRVLIGMGSILMDGVRIGEDSIIGAGSLLIENTVIPPRTLALGTPCKIKRELKEEEIQFVKMSALHYAEKAKSYSVKK